MLSKIQGYLIAFGVGIVSIMGVVMAAFKAGKDKVNAENEKHQKEALIRAHDALKTATKEGGAIEDDAIQKADNDDFSGFNNKL